MKPCLPSACVLHVRRSPPKSRNVTAKHLNLSPSAINLWEAGTPSLSASALAELSRWYHVSCDWLLWA